uniref:SAV n=1 Tax=Schmidtea mediterranea TaxID=79327 RepID=W8E6C3_SCHMD|nr:SAV [Schmidtea mediterranea]
MSKIKHENDIILLSIDANWMPYNFNSTYFSRYLSVDNSLDLIFYSSEVLNMLDKNICAEFEISYELPKGWFEIRSSRGRMCFLDTINKISTWTNPTNNFIIPFGWERIDSETEGIYYHHIFLNHCQRYNPNLWIQIDCKRPEITQRNFLAYFKNIKNKNIEMNMLFFAFLIFKNDNNFTEVKSMLYNDLISLYEALEMVMYLKIKDIFTKYEKLRAEISLRLFLESSSKQV